MPTFWKELNKWQQRATGVSAIAAVVYLLFVTFRAGVSFPIRQEMRLSTIEGGQMLLSNKVEEIIYKQDQQHDLLIRIEERLWPNQNRRRVVGITEPKIGSAQ